MKEEQASGGESDNNGEGGNFVEESTSYRTETNLENGEAGKNGNCTRNEATANEKEEKDMTVEDKDRQPLTGNYACRDIHWIGMIR